MKCQIAKKERERERESYENGVSRVHNAIFSLFSLLLVVIDKVATILVERPISLHARIGLCKPIAVLPGGEK